MTSAETDVELSLVVVDRNESTDGVVVLTLRERGGSALPRWTPGAHIDVAAGPDTVRQFSLCGAVGDAGSWRIGVLLEPAGRGGSEFIHRNLYPGTEVRCRGPRNHFSLVPAARYLFVAGGIGITPIVPMLAAAEAAGVPWALAYGGRTRASMGFVNELVDSYGDKVGLYPQDEFGLLDLAALTASVDAGTAIYCCGPGPLLDAIETVAAKLPASLHVERFSPKQQAEPILHETFEVELTRSRLTLQVPPDRSILEMAEEEGVFVLSSCEEGICGTCQTNVLEGVPDHRDSVLSDEEQAANTTMMICCSRSATPRLVLDL